MFRRTLILASAFSSCVFMSATLAKPPAEVPADAKAAVDHAKQLSRAFRAVSRAVAPGVVSIEAVAAQPVRRLRNGQFMLPQGPVNPQQPQARGQGTGFVVDENGYIVTNNHVVRAAQRLTVRFSDGREAPAELVGTDAETDIAVLRVAETDLVPLAFGDSDAADVGDWVLALGSPFGLNDSVTAGIISAKERQVGLSPLESYLQTDATINPGNSGGPLVDMDGRVVGINTAIESRSGGSDGVGFAIPSNMAREVVEAIIAGGTPARGFLGVVMQPLDRDLAASFGHTGQGVLISGVAADSPADEAGLQSGDIIVRVNGEATPHIMSAQRAIKLATPGEECTLEIVRHGESMTFTATLQEFAVRTAAVSRTGLGAQARPRLAPPAVAATPPAAPAPTTPAAPAAQPAPPLAARVGLAVAEIDASLAHERAITDMRGVMVAQVAHGGAGARAGLRAGDIVRKVGDTPVTDVEQFDALVNEALGRGHSVRLMVERNGDTRFVLLRGA